MTIHSVSEGKTTSFSAVISASVASGLVFVARERDAERGQRVGIAAPPSSVMSLFTARSAVARPLQHHGVRMRTAAMALGLRMVNDHCLAVGSQASRSPVPPSASSMCSVGSRPAEWIKSQVTR